MSRSPQTFIALAAVLVVAAAAYTLMSRPSELLDTTPPVADAGPDVSMLVGESFTLDGGGSVDDGVVSSFEWSLGDGSTKTGSTVTHSYGEAGVYTVTLTVTDGAGNVGQDTLTVTASEPEPRFPAPTVDGSVSAGEYLHSVQDPSTGMRLSWSNNATHLYVALESGGSGWVAAGFDPVQSMRGANFIIGYVSSGTTFISDESGVSNFAHSPDTSLGGTNDVLAYAGTEPTGTVIEFLIPMDSGDAMDKPLLPGGIYTVLVSYNVSSDNFTTIHTARGSITVQLD
ncbi:hypothetical protein A3K81_05170 [Candidatus Bathyarchaeota archaeon RBG_13_60_20]|nr:MAG: hypothetical protein A3K81_05170 [Candidatus Bathyarchaeota archaeon RBG_13_60_20]